MRYDFEEIDKGSSVYIYLGSNRILFLINPENTGTELTAVMLDKN